MVFTTAKWCQWDEAVPSVGQLPGHSSPWGILRILGPRGALGSPIKHRWIHGWSWTIWDFRLRVGSRNRCWNHCWSLQHSLVCYRFFIQITVHWLAFIGHLCLQHGKSLTSFVLCDCPALLLRPLLHPTGPWAPTDLECLSLSVGRNRLGLPSMSHLVSTLEFSQEASPKESNCFFSYH